MPGRLIRSQAVLLFAVLLAIAVPAGARAAAAPKLPEIRTDAGNAVPVCATPERLMAFLQSRNPNLDPRFRDIARWYRHWGEAWRVRWDYAFFQMVLETNFLTYRRPDGRMGDVDPAQNNFAGIGTTGGGVPGDSYPDVKTGVLAQIQHLVVYSGERLAEPVAPRTRLKQDHILSASLRLQRTVRFSDLAKRWAVDPKYGKSIEWVAGQFRDQHCKGRGALEPQALGAPVQLQSRPRPVKREQVTLAEPRLSNEAEMSAARASKTAEPRAELQLTKESPAIARLPHLTDVATSPQKQKKLATVLPVSGDKQQARLGSAEEGKLPGTEASASIKTRPCAITSATYGGRTTVLIRADTSDATHIAALTVLDGFEDSMTGEFIRSRMPKGQTIGKFDDKGAALKTARAICATAQP